MKTFSKGLSPTFCIHNFIKIMFFSPEMSLSEDNPNYTWCYYINKHWANIIKSGWTAEFKWHINLLWYDYVVLTDYRRVYKLHLRLINNCLNIWQMIETVSGCGWRVENKWHINLQFVFYTVLAGINLLTSEDSRICSSSSNVAKFKLQLTKMMRLPFVK